MRKVLALGLALLGCEPAIEGTPGDLRDILPRGNTQLVLNSRGDELTLWYEADNTCVRLVPTTATVNGELMEPKSLGSGLPYDGERAIRDLCVRPSWMVPPRPADEAVTEFVISDPAAEIRARFQTVTTRRTATLIVPDGGVHPGQRIDVAWTPESDILRLKEFTFSFESDAGVERWEPVNSIVSKWIPIDVPADARSGTLSISGAPISVIEQCEPAPTITCKFARAPETLVVPLTISP